MTSYPASQLIRRAHQFVHASDISPILPVMFFMTDPDRTPDPVAVARSLPRGCGVILRHYGYGAGKREALAHALGWACKRQNLVFLVGADSALAQKVDADGVHLPQALVKGAADIKRRHPNWIVTAAAHSQAALRRAARSRVDAVFLSPVFPTASHPGQAVLGPLKFAALTKGTGLAVYGLGGIDARNMARLQGSRLAGVAAIGAAIGIKS